MHSSPSLSIAIIAVLLAAGAAGARPYPHKPIRVVMPFPIGGPSDILGRAVAQKLGDQMGANLVPDNRPGAGGNLGLALAAKAPPDGYTILVTSSAIAVSPSLYAKLDYDAAKDFAPIARLAEIPNVLIVNPSVQAKTLKEFVALARAQSRQIKLWLRRRRHDQPSRQRAPDEPGENQPRAYPLQRRVGGRVFADRRRSR